MSLLPCLLSLSVTPQQSLELLPSFSSPAAQLVQPNFSTQLYLASFLPKTGFPVPFSFLPFPLSVSPCVPPLSLLTECRTFHAQPLSLILSPVFTLFFYEVITHYLSPTILHMSRDCPLTLACRDLMAFFIVLQISTSVDVCDFS